MFKIFTSRLNAVNHSWLFEPYISFILCKGSVINTNISLLVKVLVNKSSIHKTDRSQFTSIIVGFVISVIKRREYSCQ